MRVHTQELPVRHYNHILRHANSPADDCDGQWARCVIVVAVCRFSRSLICMAIGPIIMIATIMMILNNTRPLFDDVCGT